MMRAPIVVGFLVLAVGAAAQGTQRRAQTAVEGTWLVASLNGRTSDGDGVQIAITITGDRYEQSVNGNVDERGTVKVDPTANPMAIDFIIIEGVARNTTQLGIFEVTGDTVKFCLNTPGAAVRPADFMPLGDHLLIIAKKK